MVDIEKLAANAKKASYDLSVLTTSEKNEALNLIADELSKNYDAILSKNELDIQKARENGLPEAMIDRLTLTKSRFEEMVEGVRKVATLADPVGRVYDGRTLESGLKISKRSVPLGVVGVIYESRPNVTVDIAALCLKSGNACFLKGGSEAFETNLCLHAIIQSCLGKSGINPDGVTFVNGTQRELVGAMLGLSDYIDVLIPRGGEKLQRMCQRESSIPVIIGGFGISHIFVDETADLKKSVDIIINAKTQKPSACNSLDTLLIHEKVAEKFISMLKDTCAEHHVTILAHDKAYGLLEGYPYLLKGSSGDFDTEFLSLKMNVALVSDVKDAITHMRVHNASHSDAILTDSCKNAQMFVNASGSACVYVNASTRFSDGGQFGLGAEVAISTQKLHARGPMALEALTTYQYVCSGDYIYRH